MKDSSFEEEASMEGTEEHPLKLTHSEAMAISLAAVTAVMVAGDFFPPEFQADVARALQKLHGPLCQNPDTCPLAGATVGTPWNEQVH